MKKIKILLIALILILGAMFFIQVEAVSLKAQEPRPFSDDNSDGKVGNDTYRFLKGTAELNRGYTIFKLYENGDTAYSKAYYCLRGRVGFGATADSDVTTDAIEYTKLGEMHENSNSIISKYQEYYGVNLNREETITFQGIEHQNVNIYNAILWILDNSYIPTDNGQGYIAEDYKKELLDKVGILPDDTVRSEITKDDLEVIQQLAIWYFANYDQQSDDISVSRANEADPAYLLGIIYDGNNDTYDNNMFAGTRGANLNKIYQYLINNAIQGSVAYGTNDVRKLTSQSREFDKSIALEIESNDCKCEDIKPGIYHIEEYYYKIGPFKIGNTPRNTIDSSGIILVDAEGRVVPRYYTFKDELTNTNTTYEVYYFVNTHNERVDILQEGTQYYIQIKKLFTKGFQIGNISTLADYDISKATLKTSSTYSSNIANFFIRENADQPVVEINRNTIVEGDEITTQSFDLSLRKFITSINSRVLIGEDIRIPKIDLTKLNTIDTRTNKKITTATYTHPKNKVAVETGDKVVYTIRIYNEGELDGTATEITDYLPAGLELVPASESTINTTYGWTSADGKTITTDYLKDTIIKAYDPTKTSLTTGETGWQKAEVGDSGLYYADVQVECKVVAEVGAQDQSLRNIAEISEDNGEDRDSVPNNVNINDYTPPTDNSTYQQDDDDYEDLVLKAKSFDLSLRKFITKIERINKETQEKEEIQIASREPVIEIEGLKNGDDTARYVHPKNTISLKRGDIITYTIRVYNEGDLAGYAAEITDYIPEGLELIEGENDIWTVNGNTLKTDALKDQKLLGYDRNLTTKPEGANWQKASDDETGLYYYDLTVVCKIKSDVTDGTVLKNIAEISSDKSEPTDIDDRDSVPGNVYEDNKHTPGTEVDGYTPGEQDDDDFESVKVEPDQVFDLALRKYIVAVNEENLKGEASRIPDIDKSPLTKAETTANYKHKKYPVEVEVGDMIRYRFSVYNEGEIDGYVYSIVDYLPQGLTFDTESNEKFIAYKDTYTEEELIEKEYAYKIEGNRITILPLNTDKLFELKAFDGTNLDSKSIDVKFKVTASNSNEDQILTNVATMTYGAKNSDQVDRDSSETEFNIPTREKLLEGLPGYKGNELNKADLTDSTYHYQGQQDDDDFEKIIIKGKPFDLALRKYISSIKRNSSEVEFNDRTPKINTETLIKGTFQRNGELEYTATYEHSKEPLVVKQGDIITYTLRIYNEGERDGYASEITDYIPEGLALIQNYNTNFDNSWKLSDDLDSDQIMKLVGEDGFYKTEEDVKNLKLEDFSNINITSLKEVNLITGKTEITTKELDGKLIKAFDKDKTLEEEGWQKAETGDGGLYYKDVQVSFLVIAPNTCKDVLINIAEISDDRDENGNPVDDRDSTPDNQITKHEDDDDYEPVILKYFDLALRKFITGVETNGKVTDITSRIPNPKIGEDGNIVYEHSKDPVYVADNDTVVYTIRVYNEGTIAGYAEEITDDIPEGLEYLPEHNINKEYEWAMIDKDGNVTKNIEEAVKITTDYLSGSKEVKSNIEVTDEETGETVQAKVRENLIKPFDSSKTISTVEPYNPDYKDVKVAFKVTEPNTSDRIIVNSAQISEDSNDDEDSIPSEWNEGEDDQDKEYIYVKYFDLSLLKWVTKTIVTVDGKTTTTETGFEPNTGKTETTGIRDNKEQEPIAKVELDKKKLNKTTVKFAYKIRVTNEGEIAGYATEITDFIPEGLEFKAEDNKAYGWVKEGENKVTTRALETVLLQPGESAEVEIIFTWKNDSKNLGLKTNIAEIREDYNEHNSKDIDSTPDNKKDPYEKEQEDDDDFALVILSLKTGKGMSYTLLITTVVILLAGGIYLIKKYVLTY